MGLGVVASLPDVVVLDVHGTRITDRGLVCLEQLTRLESLNLSHTKVTWRSSCRYFPQIRSQSTDLRKRFAKEPTQQVESRQDRA
jgi:hypothetical protein